jgi:hypothetical protein
MDDWNSRLCRNSLNRCGLQTTGGNLKSWYRNREWEVHVCELLTKRCVGIPHWKAVLNNSLGAVLRLLKSALKPLKLSRYELLIKTHGVVVCNKCTIVSHFTGFRNYTKIRTRNLQVHIAQLTNVQWCSTPTWTIFTSLQFELAVLTICLEAVLGIGKQSWESLSSLENC